MAQHGTTAVQNRQSARKFIARNASELRKQPNDVKHAPPFSHSPASVRVSPYPMRNRTPTRGSPSVPSDTRNPLVYDAPATAVAPEAAPRLNVALFRESAEREIERDAEHEAERDTEHEAERDAEHEVERDVGREFEVPANPPAQQAHAGLYQLLVRPIVKQTVGQRDTSGQALPDAVVNGSTFTEIIQRLWSLFRERMRSRAVRTDDVWSNGVPDVSEWSRTIQFKVNRHLVDPSKTEQAWNVWLVRNRGRTVQLVIYEYGTAIASQQQLEAFLDTCIRPQQIDRAGATAEVSLRDIVHRLQAHWQGTFQAEAVVWRMWANHITRNLDRSTWDEQITQPPPPYVSHLLRVAENQFEQHLSGMMRSAHLALDCVNASIEDLQSLHDDWEVFGRRLDGYRRSLATRRAVIRAFVRDVLPPAREDVIDLLALLQNVQDIDHAE